MCFISDSVRLQLTQNHLKAAISRFPGNDQFFKELYQALTYGNMPAYAANFLMLSAMAGRYKMGDLNYKTGTSFCFSAYYETGNQRFTTVELQHLDSVMIPLGFQQGHWQLIEQAFVEDGMAIGRLGYCHIWTDPPEDHKVYMEHSYFARQARSAYLKMHGKTCVVKLCEMEGIGFFRASQIKDVEWIFKSINSYAIA